MPVLDAIETETVKAAIDSYLTGRTSLSVTIEAFSHQDAHDDSHFDGHLDGHYDGHSDASC